MSHDPAAVLKEVFGFDEFRPGQREVVDHLLAGRSAAAVFPTGGVIEPPGWGPVVVDLAGLEASDAVTLLVDHDATVGGVAVHNSVVVPPTPNPQSPICLLRRLKITSSRFISSNSRLRMPGAWR